MKFQSGSGRLSIHIFLLLLLGVTSCWCRGVPYQGAEKKEGDKDAPIRAMLEGMQRLRETLQMGDEKEYRRYWQELMESSPGGWKTTRCLFNLPLSLRRAVFELINNINFSFLKSADVLHSLAYAMHAYVLNACTLEYCSCTN